MCGLLVLINLLVGSQVVTVTYSGMHMQRAACPAAPRSWQRWVSCCWKYFDARRIMGCTQQQTLHILCVLSSMSVMVGLDDPKDLFQQNDPMILALI